MAFIVPEESKPKTKFKVGDKITEISNPEWGMGIIKGFWGENQTSYAVQYTNPMCGSSSAQELLRKWGIPLDKGWTTNDAYVKAWEEPKPRLKFKVGDKITHLEHPEWGAGIIIAVGSCDYYVQFPQFNWVTNPENALAIPEPIREIVWTDKEGRDYTMPELGTAHLVNIIEYLKEQTAKRIKPFQAELLRRAQEIDKHPIHWG